MELGFNRSKLEFQEVDICMRYRQQICRSMHTQYTRFVLPQATLNGDVETLKLLLAHEDKPRTRMRLTDSGGTALYLVGAS